MTPDPPSATRVTPSAPPRANAPGHVPAIDGFRGTAALLVTIFHCWLYTDPPLDGGPIRALTVAAGLGVDFFFVISGFVLFLPVVRHGGSFGSLGGYALRRVARIVPAYYVAVFVQAAATPVLTAFASPFASAGGFAAILAHLLFLQHSVPRWLFRKLDLHSAVMGFGVNGALWSLTIEAIFYVALPIVAGFYFRNPRAGFVLGVGGALAWRWLAFHLPSVATAVDAGNAVVGNAPRLLEQFPGYLGHFAFGMSAAYLFVRTFRRLDSRLARNAEALQIVALVLLLVAMIGYGSTPRGMPVGIYARYLADLLPPFAFAALMLATTLAGPRGQWAMANRFARWIGDVSYGVFLWHFPLILFFSHTLGWVTGRGNGPFLLLVLLVLPGAFLFGWLSRRFIEEPAIAWARARAPRD